MRKKTKLTAMGMGLLLLLSSLLACQPTPEEEVVTNKGDRVLEEKISAVTPTQNPTKDEEEATAATVHQYTFPDRWEEVYDAGNELILTFNADIVQKEDGIYPVYRSKNRGVDKGTMEKVLSTLLPAPVSVHKTGMTKDDWKEEMERYVKEMAEHQERMQLPPEERVDMDESIITQDEIDQQLKWYAEQMASAPEALEEVVVSDYSNVRIAGGQVFQLSDGEEAYVYADGSFWEVAHSSNNYGMVIVSYDRQNLGDAGLTWQDATITQEEALAVGQEALDKLGYEGFALVEVYEADYVADGWKHLVSGGYYMCYKRDFGGYPLLTHVEPSQNLSYGDSDEYAVNAIIGEEIIKVYVDETGVRYMEYDDPKEIVKEENPAVELLDFETVQKKIRKALTYGLTGNTKEVEIYKMVLSVNTQRMANSKQFYYEVPCWIVYYDAEDYSWYRENNKEEEIQVWKERKKEPSSMIHQALYINAIDGTIFHVNYDW